MPRQLRIQFPGAIYDVMSRGDRREDIFLNDADRQDFLKILAEACLKTGWQVHAYCLMNDHFHLVIETPAPNLVEGMRWLLSAYTIRLNRRHKLCGHVFSGRYKSLLVEGRGGYLKTVCDYVHLNPVGAKLLKGEERLRAYPWSSLVWYVAPKGRPQWMRVDRLLAEHGALADTAQGRMQFEKRMEARRREKMDARDQKAVERGWCLGSPEFRQSALEKLEGASGENHPSEVRRDLADRKAARIIKEELGRLGWKPRDLAKRRKSDPDKLDIAARLRRETTLTVRRIAERIHLGTPNSANALLHKWMLPRPQKTRKHANARVVSHK